MTYVLVRVTFEEFEIWKAGFTAASSLRQEYGSQGVTAFRSPDKPNQVTILGAYEDLARAQQLFQSQEFRDATKRAGVTSPPEVSFVEQVLQLPT
jgi:quinol monooxygenase YgiN